MSDISLGLFAFYILALIIHKQWTWVEFNIIYFTKWDRGLATLYEQSSYSFVSNWGWTWQNCNIYSIGILKQGPLLIFFFSLNYWGFNDHVLYRIFKFCHRPFQASKRSWYDQALLGLIEPSEPPCGFIIRYTLSTASKNNLFFSHVTWKKLE